VYAITGYVIWEIDPAGRRLLVLKGYDGPTGAANLISGDSTVGVSGGNVHQTVAANYKLDAGDFVSLSAQSSGANASTLKIVGQFGSPSLAMTWVAPG